MSRISRRELIGMTMAALGSPLVLQAGLRSPSTAAGRPGSNAFLPATDEKLDLVALDRARILRAAQQYMKEKPITLTQYSSPRSAGGKHDYFSEADYWWPDPKNPAGPYIQRDGESNPANFNDHRLALI